MNIQWLPWSRGTFERAAAEGRPVFLSLVARWGGLCRLMDRTTFADPEVLRLLRDTCLPVRVDADERPDINERYNLGAWPTSAFLTEAGEVIVGGTFFEPDQMRKMLEQLRANYILRRGEIDRAIRDRDEKVRGAQEAVRGARRAALSHEAFRKTIRGIVLTFDPVHGGFGRQPKFPLPSSLAVLLRAFYETGGSDFREILVRTLNAMGDHGLFDHEEGGFFRCVINQDWTGPQLEKLTEENAAIMRAYLDAWVLTGTDAYRNRAVRTLEYMKGVLLDDRTGLFGVAQESDEEYHAIPCAERGPGQKPAVDRRILPAPNAAAASAFLHASFILRDPSFREIALRCLETLEVERVFPRDRILAAFAFLDAFEATGEDAWRDRAEREFAHVLRTCRSAEGGILDRRPEPDEDVGELKRERPALADNAIAADGMFRLAAHLDDPKWRERAKAVLTSFPDFLDDYGHHTAEYGLAMERAVAPPVEIEILVPSGAGPDHPLAATALSAYVPRRVVKWKRGGEPSGVRVLLGGKEICSARLPGEVATMLRDLRTLLP